VLFELLGVPLALNRLFEPYVIETFKSSVRSLFKRVKKAILCCRKPPPCSREKSKVNFANESLCSFLNSVMNIELVYLILLGVNQFME
jgi:hypothetical protein